MFDPYHNNQPYYDAQDKGDSTEYQGSPHPGSFTCPLDISHHGLEEQPIGLNFDPAAPRPDSHEFGYYDPAVESYLQMYAQTLYLPPQSNSTLVQHSAGFAHDQGTENDIVNCNYVLMSTPHTHGVIKSDSPTYSEFGHAHLEDLTVDMPALSLNHHAAGLTNPYQHHNTLNTPCERLSGNFALKYGVAQQHVFPNSEDNLLLIPTMFALKPQASNRELNQSPDRRPPQPRNTECSRWNLSEIFKPETRPRLTHKGFPSENDFVRCRSQGALPQSHQWHLDGRITREAGDSDIVQCYYCPDSSSPKADLKWISEFSTGQWRAKLSHDNTVWVKRLKGSSTLNVTPALEFATWWAYHPGKHTIPEPEEGSLTEDWYEAYKQY